MSPQAASNSQTFGCPSSSLNMAHQSVHAHQSVNRRHQATVSSGRKLSLATVFNRRPVRRALIELGRCDRKANTELADKLLTISAERFKEKWDFDPIKMKPTTTGYNGNIKYEWERITSNKNELAEGKQRLDIFCSLIPNFRTHRVPSVSSSTIERTNISNITGVSTSLNESTAGSNEAGSRDEDCAISSPIIKEGILVSTPDSVSTCQCIVTTKLTPHVVTVRAGANRNISDDACQTKITGECFIFTIGES